MTPQQLNLALAKWDGWTCRNCGNGPDKCTGCDFDDYPSYVIPSYTADLNAVHELEKKLLVHRDNLTKGNIGSKEFADYLTQLSFIIERDDPSMFDIDYGWFAGCIIATALQRCEALARTLGIWEDEQ